MKTRMLCVAATLEYYLVLKDCFQSGTQVYSEKENSSAPNWSRPYDLPISTSVALPLIYRGLVVTRPLYYLVLMSNAVQKDGVSTFTDIF